MFWESVANHGCAERAAASGDWNVAQAFRTGFCGGVGWSFTALQTGHQCVHGSNYKKVNGGGDQQKGDNGVYKISNRKFTAIDFESNGREVRFTHNGRDEWRNEVLDECRDHRAKGRAHYNRNGQIQDIPAQNELLKSLEHGISVKQRRGASPGLIPAAGEAMLSSRASGSLDSCPSASPSSATPAMPRKAADGSSPTLHCETSRPDQQKLCHSKPGLRKVPVRARAEPAYRERLRPSALEFSSLTQRWCSSPKPLFVVRAARPFPRLPRPDRMRASSSRPHRARRV